MNFWSFSKLKIAPNQVQVYTQHLVNAFLIHQVKRYDIAGKRLFEIGEKYYFENLGIRNALWGYRLEDLGKIMENVVYNHLIAHAYTIHVGVLDSNEIDFIAEKDGEKIYVQVALALLEQKTHGSGIWKYCWIVELLLARVCSPCHIKSTKNPYLCPYII